MSSLRVNTITDLAGTGAPTATYGITGAISAATQLALTSQGNKVRFNFANLGGLPDAGTYGGMFAKTDDTNKAYFSNGTNWKELISEVGGQTIQGALTVTGNLTVQGTTTRINTTDLDVSDSIIRLRTGQSVSAGVGGISVVQTTDASSAVTSERTIRYNNTGSKWEITNDGTNFLEVSTGDSSSKADLATANTFAGNNTFTGRVDFQDIRETVTDITLSSDAGTANYTSGEIFYIDASGAGANLTIDATNIPTDNGKILNLTFIVSQGGTGRTIGTFKIDGTTITVKNIGAAAPTPTNSAIDVFSYSLLRRGDAWTVLAGNAVNFA
tara:strand:- start:14731 stop:15711 length:981 start_codon:yes stop_codon:yes gene_type:complete